MDQWTVAVLGDGGVGKTALAVQTYDPTIEDAYRKEFIIDDSPCLLEVLDTAGQEEYTVLRDQWVRAGQGFILVYSVVSRSTFDRLEVFRRSVIRVGRENPILLLVGNKCDQPFDREVSREEGVALARQFGCGFFETSAKTGQNVEQVFMTLVRALRQKKAISAGPESAKDVKKKKKCIIL